MHQHSGGDHYLGPISEGFFADICCPKKWRQGSTNIVFSVAESGSLLLGAGLGVRRCAAPIQQKQVRSESQASVSPHLLDLYPPVTDLLIFSFLWPGCDTIFSQIRVC